MHFNVSRFWNWKIQEQDKQGLRSLLTIWYTAPCPLLGKSMFPYLAKEMVGWKGTMSFCQTALRAPDPRAWCNHFLKATTQFCCIEHFNMNSWGDLNIAASVTTRGFRMSWKGQEWAGVRTRTKAQSQQMGCFRCQSSWDCSRVPSPLYSMWPHASASSELTFLPEIPPVSVLWETVYF